MKHLLLLFSLFLFSQSIFSQNISYSDVVIEELDTAVKVNLIVQFSTLPHKATFVVKDKELNTEVYNKEFTVNASDLNDRLVIADGNLWEPLLPNLPKNKQYQCVLLIYNNANQLIDEKLF